MNAATLKSTVRRSAVVVAVAGLLFTMLGVIVPAASNASSAAVVCKLKANKRVVCPTNKLRGPRGPQGPAGPAGPVGPAGPAGGPAGTVQVRAFNFLATGAQPNTTITTLTGAVAEAGCSGGVLLADRLRATADNGATQVVNPRTNTEDFEPDFDIGETVSLDLGPDDIHLLTYMSAGGAQNASAQYSASETSLVGGTFDCAIFGTISVNG